MVRKFVIPVLVLSMAALSLATENDAQQAARDATVVETVLRLEGIDVNTNPRLKATVLRHLGTQAGTLRYVELVEKLKVRGVEDELLRLALENPASTQGVKAVELLLQIGETEQIRQVIDGKDEPAALAAVNALGHVGSEPALDLLKPLVDDLERSRPLRTNAAVALGRNRLGQRFLLSLVQSQKLPADLKFTVANALYAAADETIRNAVAKHLELPVAAQGTPLPPVAQLVQRRGDIVRGQQLYNTTATCNKCHKLRGEGKEVGPDLSEIGGKLSREAMFVSILDPSAGISHSYESYSVVLDSGNIVTGTMVNRTDEQITLRTVEAIDKTIRADEIDELVKSKVSLMPADLQKTMSAQDLVDVVEFLTTLKKPGAESRVRSSSERG